MSGIDKALEELLEKCPVLLDGEFQAKHPGIAQVASFLDASSETMYRLTGKFYPFDKLGVRNIAGYIGLIQRSDSEAVGLYERIRDLFGFG